MTEFIFTWHQKLWALVMAFILISMNFSFYGWRKKRPYKKINEIFSRTNIGLVHTQMLMGIILMTHSTKLSYNSFSFSNTVTNYWSYVHPILMFAGIICVTLALILVRNKKDDQQKHLYTWVLNSLAFLFIGLALYLMVHIS
jgi:4-hydroxybenzoate polyprenyltransferase